uniref:Ribosomal protein S17 n=1 Tax=Leptobrachium leishanense TaxID=445787 RepID=A0A8C5MAC5_9ANUR
MTPKSLSSDVEVRTVSNILYSALGFLRPRCIILHLSTLKLNCHSSDHFFSLPKSFRHKNMSVHPSPCFRDVQIRDIVTVGERRPLSKTVRFNILKVTKAARTKKQFQKF